MLKRPTPKKLSAEECNVITSASAQQTGHTQRIKSYDPDFPVFDVPVNQKILAYIPNHRIVNADGIESLRMDKFAAHPVIDGRSYGNVRCSYGVNLPSLKLDGTCPFCDAVGENWDLYRVELDGIAKAKGIDPEAPESKELLKNDSKNLLNNMAVKAAEVWYTFPIVVIECEEKDGQLTVTPKKNAEGQITGTPMWYSIREKTYQDKWEAGFDTIETADGDTPSTPAGLWAILNFTYTPKSGNPDKMGSARSLKVSFKQMGEGYNQWATYFDQLTENWTPEKAMETVVLDVVRDMDEMVESCDSVMKPVREKLAMHELAGNNGIATPQVGSNDANAVLAQFGVEDKQTSETPAAPAAPAGPAGPVTPPVGIGEMPNTGVAN